MSIVDPNLPAAEHRNWLRCLSYNDFMAIPREIQGQKYISLATFRKNGEAVYTPVWFGEDNDELYVKSRSDSGKYKRIRNNPQVRIAPCTVRGKITGPEFPATARILPAEDWPRAQRVLERKYWLTRLSFLSRKENVYLEITVGEVRESARAAQ